MGDNDYNHPVRVVWRDLLRKHMKLAQEKNETERKKLIDFIFEYETIYNDILKDDIQA
jgi:hypothetical protein